MSFQGDNIIMFIRFPIPGPCSVLLMGVFVGTTALLSACGGSDSVSGVPRTTAAPQTCAMSSFASLNLTDAKITSANVIPAGVYTPTGTTTPLQNLPSFCRITGTASPTSDSLINFELWVPVGQAWNGKLVTTGNGGYSPALSYGDMGHAMQQGYAVLGGDTGHQSSDPNDMTWGVGHPQKIIDWGTRSIHAITVPGKAIITSLMAQAASHAYYYGCSTGGHQGYAEVQQYPDDFDGVIAGDPGNNRVALNGEFLWRFLANHVTNDNSTPLPTQAKVSMVTRAAIAACDSIDGVTDGVVSDPRACTADKFNVASLLCKGADAPDCLTAPQLAAVQKVYQGPVNPVTGAQIYPGPVIGSESGWPSYWGTTTPTRVDFWRYWVFNDPNWNWWTFTYDRDFTYAKNTVGPMVDQTNPDISQFKAHGGKLITYQGWADPVVNPLDTIAYYDKVNALQGSQATTDSFFRLFMVPGMGHCSGGVGQTFFGNSGSPAPVLDSTHDLLSALDKWVTAGQAPDAIIASTVTNGAATSARPLCPYPKKAVYGGAGDPNLASSFSCR